jgi:SPX domain protein involved in polyphosphate accumulation
MAHKLQANRYELKYVVDERTARRARDFVRAHLVPDEYARADRDYSYYIHSLYLDSADLAMCEATLHGHKNRVKLRVRFYDDRPESPIFLEIKRRVKDVILKERAAVKKSSVDKLLCNRWPERSDLFDAEDDDAYRTAWRFCDMRDALRADGRIFVSYLREAWVSPNDDSVRVTVDRDLATAPWERRVELRDYDRWRRPPLEGVVLELKFTDRYPMWMQDLVRSLNLNRGNMAKYVQCMTNDGPSTPILTPDGRSYLSKWAM